MKKIVLCATQRSGSTMIVEDMRNSGVLGRAEEYFIPWRAERTDLDWKAQLERIFELGSTPNGVFAVKVMADQVAQLDGCLAQFHEPVETAPDKPFAHFRDVFRDALWVWIRREDTVAQAISRAMALTTGVNHATASAEDEHFAGNLMKGYDQGYNAHVRYDFEMVHGFVDQVTAETVAWRAFFGAHAMDPLELVYEAVAADPDQRHLGEMAARIGLSERPEPQPRRLVKMANETSRAWHARYCADVMEGRARRRPPAAPDPRSQPPAAPERTVSMVTRNPEEMRETTQKVVRRWADTPYYDAVEKAAEGQWQTVIAPFLEGHEVDFATTLELACGHGRMTRILLENAGRVIAIDPLQENIDFCTDRFEGEERLTLIRNDGIGLTGVEDGTVSFMFCWDSMVHFDSDVVRRYLAEAFRVLKPGGHFFTHHSNRDASPGGDFQRAPHARNFMTVPLFAHYARKEGLVPVRQKEIGWGRGDKYFEALDGLALLQKPAEAD